MDKIEKLLKRLSAIQRQKMKVAVFLIVNDQLGGLDVKKVSGFASIYRVRCGNYRLIFKKTEDGNSMIDIRKRNENTYKNL